MESEGAFTAFLVVPHNVFWKRQDDEESLLLFLARQLLFAAEHCANEQAEIWRTSGSLEIYWAAHFQSLVGR